MQDALDSLRIDVKASTATDVTSDAQRLISQGLENRIFVCQTQYTTLDGAYQVLLTYPCKTLNLNEREVLWQPDTGPVLFFPELDGSVTPRDAITKAQLAYVAFNGNHPVRLSLSPNPHTRPLARACLQRRAHVRPCVLACGVVLLLVFEKVFYIYI